MNDHLPASSENQISYAAYCQLGGCRNSDLQAVLRRNGTHHYFTYHHVGYGAAYWKQDVPAGPLIKNHS
jgi:hypothetical protein